MQRVRSATTNTRRVRSSFDGSEHKGSVEAAECPIGQFFWKAEMRFADFVCFEAIVGELQATDRNGAISELAGALEKADQLGKGNLEKVMRAVIKRENEASTGVGKGIAVPHVKHKAVNEIIAAVGQSSRGIDFSALDRQPVYTVFLLISPVEEPDRHLQAMEKIFKHIQQEKFRKFMRQSQTAEQIEDLLREVDENPSL